MMTKPRVVQIVTSPHTAKSFLRGQLWFLREQGFDVTVVSAPGPELEWVGEQEGVSTVGVPMRREPSPCHDALTLTRLTRLLTSLAPEIVHCGTPKASFLGGIAAWLARVPVRLMTLRGMRADGLNQPMKSIVLAMERISCRTAHRVYCVSPSLRERALELRLASPQKLKVLANGCSNGLDAGYFSRSSDVLKSAESLRQRLRLAPETPILGFVGRLVQDKGVGELVEAFKSLQSEFAGLTLLLVGPIEEYNGLTCDLRDEISSNPRIIRLGSMDDPRPAYALMTVLALPSYREGFPNVAIEGTSMGVPVVATRITGCVDAVVDGVTGLLVPPRNSPALADAIGRYLRAPELRFAHAAAGRERVIRDYAPTAIWEALAQEYRELLRQAHRPETAGVLREPPRSLDLPLADLEVTTDDDPSHSLPADLRSVADPRNRRRRSWPDCRQRPPIAVPGAHGRLH